MNDFVYMGPSVIMEGASMIDFLKKFRSILVDKGTNTVYRVKDLIGYEYRHIHIDRGETTSFENGIPIYYYDSDVSNTQNKKSYSEDWVQQMTTLRTSNLKTPTHTQLTDNIR